MLDYAFWHFFLIGAFLGFSSGVSPGPLLTLVITETLKHNKKEGIKIALAPLLTDFPIILGLLLIFHLLPKINFIMSIISFAGAVYLAYLAYDTFRMKDLKSVLSNQSARSYTKGIIANLLNPSPYLFWSAVGIPLATKAMQAGWLHGVLYFFAFYLMMIGAKIGIAFLVDKSKTFLVSRFYFWAMKVLAGVLLFFALYLCVEALHFWRR